MRSNIQYLGNVSIGQYFRPSVVLIKTTLDNTWYIIDVWISFDCAGQSTLLASDLRA